MKLLVVEDDARTREFITNGLRQAGHTVDEADDGLTALDLALVDQYDVLVLDRMLPRYSGLELIRSVRAQGLSTPCLFLSAVGAVDDRVEGLNAGADDYLVKPFAFSELLARVHALERRSPLARRPEMLRAGDLEIDPAARTVRRAGKPIELTAQEFKLLEYLTRRAGQLVTRTMLLEALWGFHFDPRTNIVDAHVSRLRAKVDREFDYDMIKTLRGAGYVLQPPQ